MITTALPRAAQVADDIPEPQVGLPVEPLVGLIEQQHIGVVQRARVRLSFCRVPPDRAPAVWSLNCPNRSRSMSSPARFSEASRRAAAKYRRCWPTVRLSLSTGSCRQYPSVPATRTSPRSAARVPARMRSRVDLPAPFSPTTATICPALTSRSAPLSTWCLPYALYTSHASSTARLPAVIASPPGSPLLPPPLHLVASIPPYLLQVRLSVAGAGALAGLRGRCRQEPGTVDREHLAGPAGDTWAGQRIGAKYLSQMVPKQ